MSKVFGWILGIGTFVGAIYLWLSRRNDISSLKTAIEVQKIRQEVASQEAMLEGKLADAATSQQTIDSLHALIALQKVEAVKLATGIDHSARTDQEIADSFSQAGL